MKHVKTLTLCLIAAFAFAAFAASSAFAAGEKLPAWGECTKVEPGEEGHYGNAGCTAPVKAVDQKYLGEYEWHPMTAEEEGTFQDTSSWEDQPVPSTKFVLKSGNTITCQALEEQSRLSVGTPRDPTPNLNFADCEAPGGVGKCFSSDAEYEGQITTYGETENERSKEGSWWSGAAQYIEGKKTLSPTVALVYQTTPEDSRFFQQIVCEAGPVNALLLGGHKKGEQLIGQITPLDTMTANYTVKLSQAGGVQLPATLEGRATKPLEALVNANTWEPIGIEATMLFPAENNNRPRELKAIK